ncbi:MAG: hypothetical protein IKO32_10255 [Lachnospiraceae bacterium]|nr:hypothetical protein [Lachnospiraceae bacterium]
MDNCPLFLLGLLFFIGIFILYFSWGKNTVFDVHDQLDETILSYVIPARHLFSGAKTYSEMMTNLPAESMKASAPLFIPLYRALNVEWAFLLQFMIETLTAFLGMYFLIAKISKNPFAALPVSVLFALLPFQPVYGLNIIGTPLLVLCFYTLYHSEEEKLPAKIASFAGIIYYTLSTHIALAGYVACAFAVLALIGTNIRDRGFKKKRIPFYAGCGLLILCYGILNLNLITGLVFGSSGFSSHREEFVASSVGGSFFGRLWNIFFYGEETYAISLHRFFLPVIILLGIYVAIRFKKLSENGKAAAEFSLILCISILVICALYVVLGSERFAAFQNSKSGFLRHTDFDRFYYFLPGCWWMLLGILGGVAINDAGNLIVPREEAKKTGMVKWFSVLVATLIFILLLAPTVLSMKKKLNIYQNRNYQNHGSEYTGLTGMAEYYHSDVMGEIDSYIGKEKSSYRIAHLGLSPAPSLVYGFYTIDGYSNNYPLEYKKSFRQIIASALEEDEVLKVYFDTWGSRAYLFLGDSHVSDNAYSALPFDFSAMKNLGCEYLLSAMEIRDTKGLIFEKKFVSAEWGTEIYLYRLE